MLVQQGMAVFQKNTKYTFKHVQVFETRMIYVLITLMLFIMALCTHIKDQDYLVAALSKFIFLLFSYRLRLMLPPSYVTTIKMVTNTWLLDLHPRKYIGNTVSFSIWYNTLASSSTGKLGKKIQMPDGFLSTTYPLKSTSVVLHPSCFRVKTLIIIL